jgi:hypothetical protein
MQCNRDGRYSINIHRSHGYCIFGCEHSTTDQEGIKNKGYRGCFYSFSCCFNCGLFLWAIYGIGRADIVIVIGNSIRVSLNIWMLVLKIKYSRELLEEE